MDAMADESNGDTSFANQYTDHTLDAPGLWAQLPPCPPWPDLN